jgi:hypothetical protein
MGALRAVHQRHPEHGWIGAGGEHLAPGEDATGHGAFDHDRGTNRSIRSQFAQRAQPVVSDEQPSGVSSDELAHDRNQPRH